MAKKKKINKSRPKLDARLSYALSLTDKELKRIKIDETSSLKEPLESSDKEKRKHPGFTPSLHGVELPALKEKGIRHPFTKPYCSAFIKFLGSRRDLEQLGVKVRSQAGDIFTGFIPLSLITRLET